ncbi:MAG: nitroreductase family protein [Candidatus Geothermarchaeales archaeon]
MDVFKVIEARRSIRRYSPRPIPEEDLRMILEAGRLAPSAGNRQPWRFIIVRDRVRREALGRAADNQSFISDAGVVLVVTGDPSISRRWYLQDPMIAVEHIVLEATALGYGTCWIGAFDEGEVKRICRIPEDLRVIALLPIGAPNESPPPRWRRPLREIAFQEEYGRPLSFEEPPS